MTDDILGHEHLDHGKHLHKGKHNKDHNAEHHTHAPNWIKSRVGKPEHIGTYLGSGSKRIAKINTNHNHNTHNHNNAKQDHKESKSESKHLILWGSAIVLGMMMLSVFIPELAIIAIILVITAVLERIKHSVAGLPIDFEALSTSVAYLAVNYGWGSALILGAIGPYVGDFMHGHISEYNWVKIVSLYVTIIVSLLLGKSSWSLFGAVGAGLVMQFILMFTLRGDVALNAIRRSINAGFNAYLIFIVLPLLHT